MSYLGRLVLRFPVGLIGRGSSSQCLFRLAVSFTICLLTVSVRFIIKLRHKSRDPSSANNLTSAALNWVEYRVWVPRHTSQSQNRRLNQKLPDKDYQRTQSPRQHSQRRFCACGIRIPNKSLIQATNAINSKKKT